jgi:hypothetical protein
VRRAAPLAVLCLGLASAFAGDGAIKPPRVERPGETWVPRVAAPPQAPAPLDGFVDLRGIFHAHSKHSHDSKMDPERIVAIANALGIDFFFMTDHPSPRSLADGLRGKHGRTLFFAGAETDGLLALDLQEPVRGASNAERIAHVKEQGGVALVAHPEDWTDWSAPFAGMEVWNLHYATLKDGPLGEAIEGAKAEKGLGKLAKILDALSANPDAKRVLAAFDRLSDEPEGMLLELVRRPRAYLSRWDELGKRRRVPGVAGNDSHENVKIGDTQLDPYERTLRVVDTHLFARDAEAKSIREALLEGRGYVAHEVFGESYGFTFFARDASGETRAVLGEEVQGGLPLTLVARAPAGGTIRLLRDGETVKEVAGTELVFEARVGGVYRVEVDVERRGRTFPWITSNPIYLREAD